MGVIRRLVRRCWCDGRRWAREGRPAAAIAGATCTGCCQKDQNVNTAKVLGPKCNFEKA
ncbi:hypothetical protein ES288_D13G200000v1 [Gossypium darwinii]|uniref:Uncharacterized protein n=1 Tax=Gossypium darwinii TaxID=34276 RepID=A0A5D1ZZY2_GOSDA|nr:hypothetical protein ES288_D13G200000v1 [Gossypium darwinii]